MGDIDMNRADEYIKAMVEFDRGDGRAEEIAQKYSIEMEQFWRLYAWYKNRGNVHEKIKNRA